MATCKEIKAEWDRAEEDLRVHFSKLMVEARAREFPPGTKVIFPHGLKKIHGVVEEPVGDRYYARSVDWWNCGRVYIRNPKTNTNWEKEACELEIVP
jgi:hypothetical protein